MSKASRRHVSRISTQTAGLALAVPQVVAHRVNRMMTAGAVPNARDQREFNLMSSEKTAAFMESWLAMSAYVLRANQQFAVAMMSSWWKACLSLTPLHFPAQQLQSDAFGMLAKGMAPIHRAAVANAKRLALVKL
jgi:hypothetical protein